MKKIFLPIILLLLLASCAQDTFTREVSKAFDGDVSQAEIQSPEFHDSFAHLQEYFSEREGGGQ